MADSIVITGASGFLGQALMRHLRTSGFLVTGFSRQRVPGLMTIANYADMPIFENAILIHLAQDSNASGSFGEKDIDLCKSLIDMPWKHVVYVSSAVVYGDAKEYLRQPNEEVFSFSDYSRVKIACEKIVSEVGGTSLRISNLYGPGMNTDTAINVIVRQIPGKAPLELMTIFPIRDFLWIEDAVSCLINACNIRPSGILNVGTGKGIAIGDLAKLALNIAGESYRPVVGKVGFDRISCLILDISKTKSLLNWSPVTDISDGLFNLLKEKLHE